MNELETVNKLISKRLIIDRGFKTPCWEFTGSRDTRYTKLGLQGGYGQIRIGGRPPKGKLHRVHVLAFKLWRSSEYTPDLNVLHFCDNPPCFNPEHLWQGNQSDNTRDAMRKGRYRL